MLIALCHSTRVFRIAAGAAPNGIGACGLFGAMALGAGGNLPVDGAVLLEFFPLVSGNLLTLLSIWWSVGQLVAPLIAWAFIPNYPANQGWRYFIYCTGAMTFAMFIRRLFLFHLFGTPKFHSPAGDNLKLWRLSTGLHIKMGPRRGSPKLFWMISEGSRRVSSNRNFQMSRLHEDPYPVSPRIESICQ
ncbi:hypothetical protein NEOLEDRAFT_838592 [Neolentinus lepideus HHB14362 ss-1]|uniref:Major facilitator superfamily (MFS) profile domain-containing protein n=1 Tax=Neolentinus lepideus HHB14362 ss-1 TaxID=1314782 RepID=A0A165P6F4_9AGAM|nr:hypothetical protein NEOLEDRAFT_838592 [Neolentinus lepideus HHB14362 ss-1]